MYWDVNTVSNKRTATDRAEPIDILTTAYGLMTFISIKKFSDGMGIMHWLAAQRNPRGGFISSQVTLELRNGRFIIILLGKVLRVECKIHYSSPLITLLHIALWNFLDSLVHHFSIYVHHANGCSSQSDIDQYQVYLCSVCLAQFGNACQGVIPYFGKALFICLLGIVSNATVNIIPAIPRKVI